MASIPKDLSMQVIMHHMNLLGDSISKMPRGDGPNQACILQISNVKTEDGKVKSFGDAQFAGPLKTGTEADRKALIEIYPEMRDLPRRLVDTSAPLCIITLIEMDGDYHQFIAGLGPVGKTENKR